MDWYDDGPELRFIGPNEIALLHLFGGGTIPATNLSGILRRVSGPLSFEWEVEGECAIPLLESYEEEQHYTC